jgi:hypothetical protein
MKSVTVYCSSSRHVPLNYFEAATELGTAMARSHLRLIYGGNQVGCMGALADAARAAGGKVIGITPQLLVDQGIADAFCDELFVTSGMRERKALLEEHGDAFIALPGGLGTFEEIFEILVAKVLGYHEKPIIFLNVSNYYDPLLAMLDHGIEQRFMKPSIREAFRVAETVGQAMEMLDEASARHSLKHDARASDTSAME